MCGEGKQRRPVRLAVIGYGKLGGLELSYSSDLDLVFLHDGEGAAQETEGERTLGGKSEIGPCPVLIPAIVGTGVTTVIINRPQPEPSPSRP